MLFYILVTIPFIILLSSLVVPLPINDAGKVRYSTLPWMTIALMSTNVFLFLSWQAPDLAVLIQGDSTPAEIDAAFNAYRNKIMTYGANSSYVREGMVTGAFSSFTGMFMHSDFLHLTSNMIFLWVFGRRVEDATGPWRFLLFYLSVGLISHTAYYVIVTGETARGIGASGAVSGVMGAYMILFPGQHVNCLWLGRTLLRAVPMLFGKLFGAPGKIMRWTFPLRAFLLFGAYVGQDILATLQAAQARELVGGVNYVAHAAGFLAGMTVLLNVRKDLLMRYFSGRRL